MPRKARVEFPGSMCTAWVDEPSVPGGREIDGKAGRPRERARTSQIVASQASGFWYNHHYDAQGNCILLSTASGGIQEQYDYDAFGYPYFYTASGETPGNVKTRFLFTGREWISNLRIYNYRNRQYQPELGRFLQPDPKQFGAGDYNLYRYCHNDPVNHTDPEGMERILADVIWNMAKEGDSGNNRQGSLTELANAHRAARRTEATGRAFSLQNLPPRPEPVQHTRFENREGELTPGQAFFVTVVGLLHPELRGFRGLGLKGLGAKTTVLGENMAQRVIPFAGQTGARSIPFGAAAEEWEAMTRLSVGNSMMVVSALASMRAMPSVPLAKTH